MSRYVKLYAAIGLEDTVMRPLRLVSKDAPSML